MDNKSNGGRPMFDQDASSTSTPTTRIGVATSVVAGLLVIVGALFLGFRPGSAGPTDPADLIAGATDAVTATAPVEGAGPTDSSSAEPPSTAAANPQTTSTVATTAAPATTIAPTTTLAPATTAPATTVAPTTTPTATVPPTTPASTTAAPTPTTPPQIWELPTIPTDPPVDGEGSPMIRAESFDSGIRAFDVQPFLLRAQLLADAWSSGDFDLARSIDLRARAGAEYESRFADLDRLSLILLDTAVSGGSYELVVLEVDLRAGATATHVNCAQYVAEGTTGNVLRRGGFELGMWERNVTPEEIRHAGDVFDDLVAGCTFPLLATHL